MEDAKDKAKGAAVKPKRAKGRKTAVKRRTKTRKLPPYNVVLLDDNDHTYEYVIEMLGKVFGYAEPKGYELAKTVDSSGRVIVITTHKEFAELKCEQITGYGADWRLERSKGAMSAVVEPAEG
jgi:ATP-dependent Clp protease adaptor protein ClpS